MKNLIRVKVYLVIIWAVATVLFLIISFPEAFNEKFIPSCVTSSKFVYQKCYNRTFSTRHPKRTGQDWLKNFHPNPGNLTAVKANELSVIETDVDYIVTETGNVKVLVVNKTIRAAGKKPEAARNTYQENLIQTIRLRREDNARRYYTPRKTRINPIDAEFIINGAQICSSDAKYMTILIIVPSTPSHNFVRDAIRSTYGSYSKRMFHIEHIAIEVTTRLLFLVGKDGKILSDRMIRNESRTHGDMVYADFQESYRNLTRKMLIALKWVSVYCSDVDFVLKVDEDVFVNIPQLAKELHRRPYSVKGAVYGYINVQSSVRRMGKWGVSLEEFPLSHYPNYASGNSYVISGNIVPRMFMISEYLPYMPIEDAFITGCLAKIVEAKVVSVPGFTYWNDPVPDACAFVRFRKISATKVTTSIMEKLWKTCNSYSEICLKPV